MEKRYTEPELRYHALIEIYNARESGLSTTDLIKLLREKLNPTGKDIEIIDGRKDDYFSQKVRNFKSHNSLEPYAKYANGRYCITESGLSKIFEWGILDNTDFNSADKEELEAKLNKNEAFFVPEIDFNEGDLSNDKVKIRIRSSILRKYAFDFFRNQGQIKCSICGFDFEEKYGAMGENYIEIHHIKPISFYSEDGDSKSFEEAIKNLMPVCPNCHKMIHKHKDFDGRKIKKFLEEHKNGR